MLKALVNMKASGSIMVALACLICAGCRPEGSVAPRQTTPIDSLTFSPGGNMLLAVAPAGSSAGVRGYRFQAAVLDLAALGKPARVIGGCDTGTAAWDGEGNGVYVVRFARDSAKLVELALSGEVVRATGPLQANGAGALSYDRATGMVALAMQDNQGQFLVLWRPEGNDLSRIRLPEGFGASGRMPPLICAKARKVVLVASDQEGFAAYDLNERTWQYPRIKLFAPRWHWSSWTTGLESAGHWEMGDGLAPDRFFIDPAGRQLWVVVSRAPVGAIPLPGGGFRLLASDGLRALDVATQSVAAPDGHAMSPLRVFGDRVAGVSSALDLQSVGVLYQRPGLGPADRVDWVVFRLEKSTTAEAQRVYSEHVVYTAGEVFLQGSIAVSESGDMMAVCRAGTAGLPEVVAVRLPSLEQIGTWLLP